MAKSFACMVHSFTPGVGGWGDMNSSGFWRSEVLFYMSDEKPLAEVVLRSFLEQPLNASLDIKKCEVVFNEETPEFYTMETCEIWEGDSSSSRSTAFFFNRHLTDPFPSTEDIQKLPLNGDVNYVAVYRCFPASGRKESIYPSYFERRFPPSSSPFRECTKVLVATIRPWGEWLRVAYPAEICRCGWRKARSEMMLWCLISHRMRLPKDVREMIALALLKLHVVEAQIEGGWTLGRPKYNSRDNFYDHFDYDHETDHCVTEHDETQELSLSTLNLLKPDLPFEYLMQ